MEGAVATTANNVEKKQGENRNPRCDFTKKIRGVDKTRGQGP